MSYLTSLTLRLAAGASRLPDEFRARHAAWLAAAQREDGGFAGRQGPSDLYYTSFALRGLALLGVLDDAQAQRAARFLAERLAAALPPIDFLALISSAVLLEAMFGRDPLSASGRSRAERVTDYLRPYRRPDGGYAKTSSGRYASTYHTFLAVSCLELVGGPLEGVPETIALVSGRRRDDGGFVELPPLAHSGTNPTAAAVGTLRLFRALDDATRHAAVAFLAGMQSAEGGFRANTRIPLSDLLSTFTALVALADLDGLESVDRSAARRYALALEQPCGGFRGGGWDDTADVEYTFYGLGTLALLSV